jgi:hypothetical protein
MVVPTLQALVATVIAALSLALDAWVAALIVTGVLAAVTAVTALMAALGKQQISKASPPSPEQTMDSVRADVAEIKEKAQQGAIFAGVKASVDRGGATATRRLTGTWPG